MASTPDYPRILTELRAAVAGEVRTPDEAGYAPIVSGSNLIQRHRAPIAVAARSTADVAAVVRIAGAAGVPITVIGGGHGDIPTVNDGVVLTTRLLTDVTVDPDAATATVGAGATWNDVLDLATPDGLAPLCGSAPAVGVGGYLLGGGMGPIGRTYGFTSDRVRSFDLVTADGRARTVTADSDPDLWWALKGGKGGFGVLTAATVDLLRLDSVWGGGEYLAADDIPALLDGFAELTAGPLPDELTVSVAILRFPNLPVLPEPLRGRTLGHLRAAFVGSDADGERLLSGLRSALGPPLLGSIGRLPYARIGTIHNDPVNPSAHITAGMLLDRLDGDTVRAILDVAGPDRTAPLAIVEIRHLGGAFAAGPGPRDAVSGREAAYGMWVSATPQGMPVDPVLLAAGERAVRAVLDAVAPVSRGTVQINFCGPGNSAAEAAAAWPVEVARRLAAVRRRVDPDRRFPFVPGAVAPTP